MRFPQGLDPILIAGPTGVGKTPFAVALAQQVGGEIVCADAYQIYQGLAVLTAQPPPHLFTQVPHHLFGCFSPAAPCDVHRWLTIAEKTVQSIQARNKIPLLVGGTGLYFKAFLQGLDPVPPTDPALRERLSQLSLPQQINLLQQHDPAAIAALDLKNPRRVQRALEIVLTTGKPLASFRQRWQQPTPRPYRGILLLRERQDLHERIARNVEAMLQHGALEEVKKLLEPLDGTLLSENEIAQKFPTACRAIGFSALAALLRGQIDLKQCTEIIQQQTRAYARRQETWFRREKDWQILIAQPQEEFSSSSLNP